MADRIMVLRYGNLVEEADTREMMADPKEDYTKSLWAVRSFKKDKVLEPDDEVPLIQVEHVTAGYGKLTVLKDISFSIYPKRTVAVVGESGSGKSTAARVITGLLPPKHGEILSNGDPLPGDFRKRTKDQLRKVQMIYQMPDTAINPRQRIRDAILSEGRLPFISISGERSSSAIRSISCR